MLLLLLLLFLLVFIYVYIVLIIFCIVVLLSGAHTLGHVNPEHSGYDGHPGWKPSDYPRANPNTVNAWDQTPTVFDNDYYFQIRKIVSINIQ